MEGCGPTVESLFLLKTFSQRTFLLYFNISFFICIQVCGQLNADYAFLVDTSGSILEEEYLILKSFVTQVIDFLLIGENLTHVGLIEYSSQASLEFDFKKSFDKQEIKKSVENLPQSFGRTRIDLALKVASEQLFTQEGGMRSLARQVKMQ